MSPDIGEVIAVGIGLVFWGIMTGGRGGGGMCVPWPLSWDASYCCWPEAPVEACGGCGRVEVEAGTFSAIVTRCQENNIQRKTIWSTKQGKESKDVETALDQGGTSVERERQEGEGERLAISNEPMQSVKEQSQKKNSELEGGERRGDQYQGTKRRFLKREKIKVKITDRVGKK